MNTTALALSLPLWKCGLKFKPLVATKLQYPVTSLVEVWIEILTSVINVLRTPSLPLWKCGLKSGNAKGKKKYVVTSLVEVWIEITSMSSSFAICTLVTSLVEVWIEIDSAGSLLDSSVVTSLVEVWIEIYYTSG